MTDDRRINLIEGVIADSAPDATMIDFKPSFAGAVGCTPQSNTGAIERYINMTLHWTSCVIIIIIIIITIYHHLHHYT